MAAHVYRPISWLGLAAQLSVYAVVVTLAIQVIPNREHGVIIAMAICLGYTCIMRYTVLANHRRGVRLTHQGRFEEAIELHQKSLDFFVRHQWIDRYRAVVLMSAAALSYREIALCNIAFCYMQTGREDQADACYCQALQLNPDNWLALSGQRLIETLSGDSPVWTEVGEEID